MNPYLSIVGFVCGVYGIARCSEPWLILVAFLATLANGFTLAHRIEEGKR